MDREALQAFTPAAGSPRRVFDEGGKFERETDYQVGIYQSDTEGGAGARIQRDKSLALSGDHLTVLEMDGPDVLGIRIGKKSNPFLLVRPGMVLRRSFDVITVRSFGNRTGGQSYFAGTPTQMILAASFGELISDAGRDREGFQPGFFTFTVDVGAIALDLSDPINWVNNPGNIMRPSIGRFGGTMRLHNRDLVNPVFLFSAQADPSAGLGTALDTFALQIDAGQKEEFRLASSIRVFDRLTSGEQLTFGKKLFAQTTGATVRLAVTVNGPVYDATDLEAHVDSNNRGVSFFS